MNPKEKSIYLINKYGYEISIMLIDEILTPFGDIFDDFISYNQKYPGYSNMTKYWEAVKMEIIKSFQLFYL